MADELDYPPDEEPPELALPKPPAGVSMACMAWWWLLLLAAAFIFVWWFWVLPNWDYSGGQRSGEEATPLYRPDTGP